MNDNEPAYNPYLALIQRLQGCTHEDLMTIKPGAFTERFLKLRKAKPFLKVRVKTP